MRVTRSYRPGQGVIERRAAGEETITRTRRTGSRGRVGELRVDYARNRLETLGRDGKVRGLELPKG